ncbi:MAG: CocE/NonD family hydrolase [Asgard group archaeon]|nr:CocE/NonD family hydrolase [Asgard group archaeon]
MRTDFSVYVEMRDGVKLSTIISRPETEEKYPALLLRLPYNAKNFYFVTQKIIEQFNFVAVIQDTRGRYDSEGTYQVLNEKEDTLDTINWISKQEWFNKELHIFGASYLGYVALQVLDEQGIKIKTIFAPTVLGDPKDAIYRGNVLQYHWALCWAIMCSTRHQSSLKLINGTWPDAYNIIINNPVEDAVKLLGWPDQIWRFFINNPDDSTWKKYNIYINEKIDTRICLIGAWYDFLLNSTLDIYDKIIKNTNNKPDLIIGPWSHNGYLRSQTGIESWEFGQNGQGNFIKDFGDFLEREKQNSNQIIRIFILRANKWLNLKTWPPVNITEKIFNLTEKFELTENHQYKEIKEFEISINPKDPVPTLGGLVWESFAPIEPGPFDQRELHKRKDILRFYTKPFTKDTTILGKITVDLWIKTISPETHFTAKLNVVEQDNSERIFQDGIFQVKGPIKKYSKITIDLLATGIEIKSNEKIGLEISWSNFPKYLIPNLKKKTTQYFITSINHQSCLKVNILEK